jgi:broad specificity phosphatase PhoE
MDLYRRVTSAIDRLTRDHRGRDIIAVGHGGSIKAAVGFALGGLAHQGLTFDIDNVSVTRLDHYANGDQSNWRLPFVNQQPWIADEKHAAMHQPAGPEVTSKLA